MTQPDGVIPMRILVFLLALLAAPVHAGGWTDEETSHRIEWPDGFEAAPVQHAPVFLAPGYLSFHIENTPAEKVRCFISRSPTAHMPIDEQAIIAKAAARRMVDGAEAVEIVRAGVQPACDGRPFGVTELIQDKNTKDPLRMIQFKIGFDRYTYKAECTMPTRLDGLLKETAGRLLASQLESYGRRYCAKPAEQPQDGAPAD